jgi:hypothetical protein
MRPLPAFTAALLATAALALPATAGAAGRIHVTRAHFDVSIKGYQLSTWSHSHTATGGCDSNVAGGGREVMRFRSKTTRMSALYVTPGGTVPTFHRLGAPLGKDGIPLRTRITRSGDLKTWGGPICSYGDGTGGETPKAKDCGTRTSNALSAELEYDLKGKQSLGLGSDFGEAKDPFANCPAGPLMFPKAINYGKGFKRLGRKLTYRELFHGPRRHILRFGTTLPNDTFETPAKTEVGWEMTITRVGGAK